MNILNYEPYPELYYIVELREEVWYPCSSCPNRTWIQQNLAKRPNQDNSIGTPQYYYPLVAEDRHLSPPCLETILQVIIFRAALPTSCDVSLSQ